MKRMTVFFLALGLALSLVACGTNGGSAGNTKGDGMTLEEIMTEITDKTTEAGVELPAGMPTTIDAESWEYATFTKPVEGAKAISADAMISAIAHSVVLVRLPEGADAKAFASEMEENANPRKWICVEAEKTIVRQHGNTVLLVMSFEDAADALANNFDALFK